MRPPIWVRAALSHPCFTGISRQHLGDLIAELADPWTAQHEAALAKRRTHARRRAAGAGPIIGWPSATARAGDPGRAAVPAPAPDPGGAVRVDRSTVTRAIHEVRPLLAARGFAVPGQPGVRLRMLADVVAYAEACGVELRIDATERIAWAGERSSGWCLRPLQAHIQRTRRRQEPTDADQN